MRVLLVSDGSKFSEAATQAVIAQARPQDAQVHVLYVIETFSPELPEAQMYYPGVEHGWDAQRKLAEPAVAKCAELLRSNGLQVTTAVELGNPKSKIIDTAQEWRADLIVIGSHGRTGLYRFFMGSLAEAVLRHAHCSVELVRIPPTAKGSKRTGGSAAGKVRRILLATDDSKFSEAALRLLMEQVQPQKTEIRVLLVVEPPPLLVVREMGGYDPNLEKLWETRTQRAEDLVAKIAETLRTKCPKVTTAVVQGDPRLKILGAAEKWKAELIVIGSLGRTGLERFLMGSVSEAVARHAHCSVEVVRIPPAA
jgi:nucleotide-binding universal stress UspA family protein